MEQTIETILTRYTPAEGNRPAKAWDQEGKDWAIWEAPLFETVKTMLYVPILLTGETKPSADGRFQNRSIRSITPANGELPGIQPAATTMPTPVAAVQQTFMPPPPMTAPTGSVLTEIQLPMEYQRAKHPMDQRAIRRAVALQAAVATLPHLETKIQSPAEVLAIAEAWETWLES